MLFLVTYDLNKPHQDYETLFAELKSKDNWWHYLDSTWIIKTSESIDALNERIQSKMDDNDDLFIVDITNRSYVGWLSKKAWTWLRKHIGG